MNDETRFLPLKPNDFHILLALREGESHGYAIAKWIRESSGGTIDMTAGNLQRTVQKLIRDGLVGAGSVDPANPRRKNYRLTALGSRVMAAETERLRQALNLAEQRSR